MIAQGKWQRQGERERLGVFRGLMRLHQADARILS